MIALEDHADVLAGQIGALLAAERCTAVSPNQYSPFQPSSSRARMLSSEDFPAPEGPMTVTKSPSSNREPDAAQHPVFGVAGLVTSFYVFEFDHDVVLSPNLDAFAFTLDYSVLSACMGSMERRVAPE